jgi:hypothetical protein
MVVVMMIMMIMIDFNEQTEMPPADVSYMLNTNLL